MPNPNAEPGRPDANPCAECGAPVEALELRGFGIIRPQRCPACDNARQARADAAERERVAEAAMTTARIPERLLGYRLDRIESLGVGESLADFTERVGRCRPRRLGVTPDNAPALRACRSWTREAGSVYLCGPVGRGKSVLASALAHRAALLGQRPMYLTEPDLWQKQEGGRYLDRDARAAGVLWLDDFGTTTAPKDWQQEMLEAVICFRYERNAPIIITSNAEIGTVDAKWGERVSSRLHEMTAGLVFVIGGGDWRMAR